MSMHSHFKHKALEMHTTKKIKQPMSCFAASAGAHRYHRQSWAVPSPPALAVHHTTKWCHLCRCKACKDPNQACRLLSASHSSQVSQTWEEKLEQRRRPKEKPKPYVQAPSSAKPRCQVWAASLRSKNGSIFPFLCHLVFLEPLHFKFTMWTSSW